MYPELVSPNLDQVLMVCFFMDYGSNSFWIGLRFKTLIPIFKNFILLKLCKASPKDLQLRHSLSFLSPSLFLLQIIFSFLFN